MRPVVVIGAGPAGLTAAYELVKHGQRVCVLEKDNTVGGLARTVNYRGFLFDIGGHRFFTKISLVEGLWKEILGDDLLTRPRLSRIYYRGKFFKYPLEPWDAFFKLGPIEAARCLGSYLYAKVSPIKPEISFEDWVVNRFGRRLFEIFFKAYTEKVWGIRTSEIRAEWAAQRIRGLSLKNLVLSAFRVHRPTNGKVIKTLITSFYYPRRGPGMMWEKARELVEQAGGRVLLEHPVEKIYWEPGRVVAVQAAGKTFEVSHLISSMPIRELIGALDPPPPKEVLERSKDFRYRDFLTVALIVDRKEVFPDNWIYIHDPGVHVGRIQNYKNWSPEMVPDHEKTCLGLEYFCFEGDPLWNTGDQQLLKLATEELDYLGLVQASEVIDGTVVRMPKAYPIYDSYYKPALATIRSFLAKLPNLYLVGRNGMHHYNNQDHSMLTGLLAARNVMGDHYDIWAVNEDDEYLEEGGIITLEDLKRLRRSQPLVPSLVPARTSSEPAGGP